MGFAVYRGGSGGGGGFAAPGASDLSQKPPLSQPWQTLGQMNNPGMPAYQALGQAVHGISGILGGGQTNMPALPPAIRMTPIGGTEQAGATGGWQSSPQMGGTTRRGSQILDAQGNVIGHYDDNNQPVYHGGQGGGMPQRPKQGPWAPMPPWADNGQGFHDPQPPPDMMRDYYRTHPPYPSPFDQPQASTSMGMAPSWRQMLMSNSQSVAPMGVPGSMQQSLYGQGLLRPAMPSMNNQSGY